MASFVLIVLGLGAVYIYDKVI